MTANSSNPWGCSIRARYGLTGDGIAVIEIAEASGITTCHDGPRDPVTAVPYGTGTLVVDALRRGARQRCSGRRRVPIRATMELLIRRLDDQSHDLPRDPRSVPGSGAAGGLAGGLWSVFNAQIVPGADFVLDRCGFDAAVLDADAVVGSVGDYVGEDFAKVLVATDTVAMRDAGCQIVSLMRRFVHR